ncbi:MAG: peptidyl-prolyl cis-trans isomerase [Candidatus Omnitrophica bacterium]|nr:peptidyl-prolyl cis-trans isomerase [Candidatus Omnitrophota bacterium]MDD5355902.1 peptidyl-prolyl cis-trans isomerase [Candidatus Omnitrophota bacterium]
MKKIILLSFLILFLSVCCAYSLEDKVVAIVNDEVITKAELNMYISMLKIQITEEGWQKYEMSEKKALENLIENRLILQEAKNNKIEVEDRYVESRLAKMRSNFSSEYEFSDFLARQGFTLSEFRKHMEEQMLADRLIALKIRNRILISPSEVTDYYNKHINDFYFPERIYTDSIFVGTENLAKEVYNKLKGGADFGELQKQYSKRGSLGMVTKGQLLKEIEDAIFNLEVGKFSKPVETSDGFYIFMAKEKLPPSARELKDVQQVIYNIIWENKYSAKLKEFIGQIKEKSYILIKDEK